MVAVGTSSAGDDPVDELVGSTSLLLGPTVGVAVGGIVEGMLVATSVGDGDTVGEGP